MPETLVLRPSRLKWTLILVASLAFALTGVLIFFVAPNGRGGGAVVTLFFGACAVVAFLQMITASLELSPAGFTIRGLRRKSTTAWSDVTSFSAVGPIGPGQSKLVEVGLADTETLLRTRAAVKAITGFGRLLPDTYGMKAEALAALMNEWHARYAGPPANWARGDFPR